MQEKSFQLPLWRHFYHLPIHPQLGVFTSGETGAQGSKKKKRLFSASYTILTAHRDKLSGIKVPKVEFLHFWVLVSGAKAESADDCLLGYLLQERNQLFQDEMGEGEILVGPSIPRSLPCPVTLSWKSVSQKSRADKGTTTSAGGHICDFLRLG